MKRPGMGLAKHWASIGTQFMPFADVTSAELPLSRLLRLSLFQVSIGISVTLLIGTLNRVMIVELNVPAWLVAVMVSLPLLAFPISGSARCCNSAAWPSCRSRSSICRAT
jgi:BCD family chlorophyll transporter-like MFS transporter